ncbi:MAG: hypothetical protein J5965_21310, partial [Aeriscardovia sp.]|nr:hypothetical protein [Aeriscardovia sp.]
SRALLIARTLFSVVACSSVCRDVPASMPAYECSLYCYGSSFCLSFCLCMMSIVYVAFRFD